MQPIHDDCHFTNPPLLRGSGVRAADGRGFKHGAAYPRNPVPESVFRFAEISLEKQACAVLRRLPPVAGQPVLIERAPGLRDRGGPVNAGAFLRERRIGFNCAAREFGRIFTHELFHFVWWKAGNPARRSFEQLLESEWKAAARGELGWSAEWRKDALRAADVGARSRPWREYCAESFCDTAAWLYAGAGKHAEFTLQSRFRPGRRAWFGEFLKRDLLSI
jgi:hypothetical protein